MMTVSISWPSSRRSRNLWVRLSALSIWEATLGWSVVSESLWAASQRRMGGSRDSLAAGWGVAQAIRRHHGFEPGEREVVERGHEVEIGADTVAWRADRVTLGRGHGKG